MKPKAVDEVDAVVVEGDDEKQGGINFSRGFVDRFRQEPLSLR